MVNAPKLNLGGAHAISYKLGFGLLPFLIFGVPLTINHKISNLEFMKWCWAAAIGTLLAAIFLLICDKTFLKNRRSKPVPNSWIFALGAALGAIKGSSTEIIAKGWFHIAGLSYESLAVRTLNSAVLGLLMISLLSYVNFWWHSIRNVREELAQDLRNFEGTFLPVKMGDDQLVREIDERLANAKSAFITKFTGQEDPQPLEVANYLRRMAQELIRPMSHKINERSRGHFEKTHFMRQLLLLLPEAISPSLPWLLALCIATNLRIAVESYGVWRGSVFLVSVCGLLLLTVLAIKETLKNLKPNWISILATLTLASLINTFLANLINNLAFHSKNPFNFYLTFFWTITVFFLVLAAHAATALNLLEIDDLENKYYKTYLDNLKQTLMRNSQDMRLAKFLHGTLSTQLLTSAFRIENLAKTMNLPAIKNEILIAQQHLNIDLAPKTQQGDLNLETVIRDAFYKWGSLIQISSAVEFEAAEINSYFVTGIGDLINEVLSNAHRHGRASNIDLTISAKDSHLEFIAINDGQAIGKFNKGFGSRLFDEVTGNSWNIENLPDNRGVKFSARVAMESIPNRKTN
jgi:hypothetical protein